MALLNLEFLTFHLILNIHFKNNFRHVILQIHQVLRQVYSGYKT